MEAFAGTLRASGNCLSRILAVTRFGDHWLTRAQVGWVLLALVVLAIPIAGIPLVVRADDPSSLAEVTVEVIAAAVWISAGALVVWRRPSDPMALLTGWFLLAGSVAGRRRRPTRCCRAVASRLDIDHRCHPRSGCHPAWVLTGTVPRWPLGSGLEPAAAGWLARSAAHAR